MPHLENVTNGLAHTTDQEKLDFARQAQKLAHLKPAEENEETGSTQAVEAKFVTPLDPVVETANGGRLPTIPVEEAAELNRLRDKADGRETLRSPPRSHVREGKDGARYGARLQSPPADEKLDENVEGHNEAPLDAAVPPSRTNPLFPPLPMYGPPTPLRKVHCALFRAVSSVLSLGFLLAIVAGAIVDAVPRILRHMSRRARLQNPSKRRPFYDEEVKRRQERKAAQRAWLRQQKSEGTQTPAETEKQQGVPQDGEFIPTEGGPDPLVVDIGYYARRVGLDAETFEVQTEDGFLIDLIHLYNPRDYGRRASLNHHEQDGPEVFITPASPHDSAFAEAEPYEEGAKKYPVLMMHGLLQSAGAYCSTDDDSLAFYLAKSGYDVWLGNNRCGFEPKHTLLSYEDPRMWSWNIRHMGVMDLAALTSRVLKETGFVKLALIAHSQGTTQTFVALAKEQRPELGEKISVFCALAPAAYAGPLIGKMYFKLMRLISPGIFRLIFGIHAFIPLMMDAHKILPAKLYGWMGYHVFSFLFSWSDSRWDRGLRNRMFQWAPTYVSAESMRWWLGRECFARQKCILATREEGALEDLEDEEDDAVIRKYYEERRQKEEKGGVSERMKLRRNLTSFHCQTLSHLHHDRVRGKFAWYNEQFPPLALWVCGADDLVDGRRLLRRFDRGREPHVRIVHKKIIEGYEHLDVIWAMDSIEKVGKEVREVIWRTVDKEVAKRCRVPMGCERAIEDEPNHDVDVPMMHSGGRLRMASISEAQPPNLAQILGASGGDRRVSEVREESPAVAGAAEESLETKTTHSRETPGEHDHIEKEEREFGLNGGRRMSELEVSRGRGRSGSEALFTDVQEKANPLG